MLQTAAVDSAAQYDAELNRMKAVNADRWRQLLEVSEANAAVDAQRISGLEATIAQAHKVAEDSQAELRRQRAYFKAQAVQLTTALKESDRRRAIVEGQLAARTADFE